MKKICITFIQQSHRRRHSKAIDNRKSRAEKIKEAEKNNYVRFVCFVYFDYVSLHFNSECMETTLEKPTAIDRELAMGSLELFEKALKSASTDGITKITLPGTDEVVKIPNKAMGLFTAIISGMARGHAVQVVDANEQMTSQEAADYLHISRPHLVKLVEKGDIPYTLVGTHRRIALHDVELYALKLKENTNKQLAFLAKQAQELQLGYQ